MATEPANSQTLRFEVDDGGPVIRINRTATLNAFRRPMIDRLRTLTDQAVADLAVFGVVITVTGKAFCSGLDVSRLY